MKKIKINKKTIIVSFLEVAVATVFMVRTFSAGKETVA